MSGSFIKKTALWLLLLAWLAVAGCPFALMLMTSVKSKLETMTSPLWKPPAVVVWDNFQLVLSNPTFLKYMSNSVVVISISVLLILISASMASFILARIPLRLNRYVYLLIIAGLIVPIHSTLLPIYLLTVKIGLNNSLWALVGPYVTFNLPISVFVLTEFMRQIPKELEEAAFIDGGSDTSNFVRIILPLSKPGLITLAIYNAVTLWNEFVFAFILISAKQNRTLPLAIWTYQGEFHMNIPAIMAVLSLAALPLIVIYIFGEEQITRGIMAGAFK